VAPNKNNPSRRRVILCFLTSRRRENLFVVNLVVFRGSNRCISIISHRMHKCNTFYTIIILPVTIDSLKCLC